MEEPKITPLARRLAEENGIDWRRLQGTGPDGTIVERDILAFLAKVMAGEVDLPPMPEEPPPVLPEEDLKRAQEALGKEGVDLSELLPEPPKTPTVQLEELEEEALELEPVLEEMDLELDLEEEALEVAEEPPPVLEEDLVLPPEEPAPSPLKEELEALLAEEKEPAETPSSLEEELAAFLAEEEAVPETLLAGEDFLTEEAPVPVPPPPPVAPTLGAAANPVAPAATLLRVYRRRLDPTSLQNALKTFAQVHGVPENPLPFLLKGAERALAELELPLRPLLGRLEGERVVGLRPLGNFLALFRQEGGEEGEGLLCFAGEEEVHTGRPSLFLSAEGVLAASGLEAPVARKLLERVALYLENPVLLLA
ncbi:pyruvate/2-oxoglutarate dehydrogenase complex, dihydrolipoamide acyltransferase component [Thermus sp. 2.9]|uniref:E3 binding domain-containing protein n=1 Tax=unclassified Thermus TaxID=2619321 RepID=UPI00054421C6|nr:E3 binding domain-containing protein [Thermus sp. 2.9]KHG66534.1 pyruvate/2-oxoglutarate dehydrogenase complex, dihydrolipoamide acyltransferase component [Thermus sp. 2.9]